MLEDAFNDAQGKYLQTGDSLNTAMFRTCPTLSML